jgi:hypothetical protein
MNKKALIAIGLTVSTLFTGLAARQVIGSQAADRCRISVDSYTILAEAQIKDMNTATTMVDAVIENPFSALFYGGEMARVSNDAKARWDEINEAEDGYLDSCVETGVMAKITESYTTPIRQEKWAIENELEQTRLVLVERLDALG